jgi:hypothetical protein
MSNAGRELDALVAVKVMGWAEAPGPTFQGEPVALEPIGGGHARGCIVPHYSADVGAAWHVVERMRLLGYIITIHTETVGYSCSMRGALVADGARADTAAHAICLAALRSVGAIE